MTNVSIFDLEQQDIELQLMEIQLKRRSLAIEREKLESEKVTLATVREKMPVYSEPVGHCRCDPVPRIIEDNHLCLHYSKSAKESLMTIADVTSEGCILIKASNDCEVISKKYNMRSLRWLKDNLKHWSKKQKKESHFWDKIARKYSKRFLEGDTISRTTVEKLCYLVDSGMMDYWFDEWAMLKSHDGQSQLDI